MRRPSKAIIEQRHPEDCKFLAKFRISRTSSPNKEQGSPKVRKLVINRKEPNSPKATEDYIKKKGYLGIHQEKQATKQVGFFLLKKKDRLPTNLENYENGAIFDTPRFGEQTPSTQDSWVFPQFKLPSVSTTSQSIDLISWVGKVESPQIDSKDKEKLSFADRVENSFINLLPPSRRQGKEETIRTEVSIRKRLLPSIESIRGSTGIRHNSDHRLSRSLDYMLHCDSHKDQLVNLKSSKPLQGPFLSKIPKVLKTSPPVLQAENFKRVSGQLKVSNLGSSKKSPYSMFSSLKAHPSFGNMDPLLQPTD